MSNLHHRLSTALQLGILLLLMMGVAIKPMLGALCETHVAAHLSSSHGHDYAGAAGIHDSTSEHQMDREHARGADGLLHEGDQSSAYADITVAVVLPAALRGPSHLGATASVTVAKSHLSGPFRPPIG